MERDIVERLRGGYTNGSNLRWSVTDVHREAADLIESLRSELDEARKALEPFAGMADVYDGNEDSDPFLAVLHRGIRINLTVGDLRRASAIRQKGGGARHETQPLQQ